MRHGPLRIMLVDDHPLVLEGLGSMLGAFADRVVVVAEARDEVSALERVAAADPDVVVSDIRLRRGTGLDLCRALAARDPGRPVVLLTVYDDEQYLHQALQAGARGYLLKQVRGDELVAALERVAAGEVVVDASLAGRTGVAATGAGPGRFWPGGHLGLTERESQVLSLIIDGVANRDIARRLFVGEETVKTHVRSVYRKLGVRDRASAVAVSLREGILR